MRFFLRNVTRCYAKNIIVQTFSVLLSHYYRITIALPSYTNACVIQVICFVGVNVQDFSFFRTYKKGLKAVPLHSHSSAMDTLTRWGAMRTHWGGIEEALNTNFTESSGNFREIGLGSLLIFFCYSKNASPLSYLRFAPNDLLPRRLCIPQGATRKNRPCRC